MGPFVRDDLYALSPLSAHHLSLVVSLATAPSLTLKLSNCRSFPVDDDGVIVLDSSSDDESDGNDRNARARSNAPQAARKSAPAASTYDSDEHAQYLVREIMSSSDSSSSDDSADSDAYDDRAAFNSSRAVTRKRKRSHNASLPKRKNELTRRKPTHKLRLSKRPTVTKAKKASKKPSKKVSSEDESDSNDSRNDDDESESESDRAPPLKKAGKKKQTGVKSRPLSTSFAPAFKTKTSKTPDYVTMVSDSDDDDESNAHSDDSEVEHRRKHQRTKSDNAKRLKTKSSSTTAAREQTTTRHARLVTEPPRVLPRRTDHAFHQLTEKLSFSELQAQRRELEQISLMHKRAAERSSGGGGSSGQSAPPVARKPPRLESRKSAQPRSRVDEIEQRAKHSAVARSGRSEAVVTVAPSPREGAIASTPKPPASASGGNNNNNVVRPTTSNTSSSSSSAMAVASATDGFTGTFRSLDTESTRPPVVHSTAWRRLLPTRAPLNILSDRATHLVPFADGTTVLLLVAVYGWVGTHRVCGCEQSSIVRCQTLTRQARLRRRRRSVSPRLRRP